MQRKKARPAGWVAGRAIHHENMPVNLGKPSPALPLNACNPVFSC
jgi:hypothetical protein